MIKYDQIFLTTTDTVTGLGAPVSSNNLKAILKIKKRKKSKGLIIMVGSIEDAEKLDGWNENASVFASKFFPGQTTLVINDNLAVRIPGNERLRSLLLEKGPCYMTSANISGEEILSLAKAKKTFTQITEAHDFGTQTGKSSKIIDIRTGRMIR